MSVPPAMSCLKPGAVRSPPSVISLSNGPGDSMLTRTFHGAHAWAMLFVRLRRAALDAPYAQMSAPPEYAAIVPMLTMLPPPSLAHDRRHTLTHAQWTLEVDREDLAPELQRHLSSDRCGLD